MLCVGYKALRLFVDGWNFSQELLLDERREIVHRFSYGEGSITIS